MKGIKKLKEEKGYFTIYAVVIIVIVMILAGFFINFVMNYMVINSTKKALQEATRTRALATDIVMKENVGIVEAIYKVNSDVDTSRMSEIEKMTVDAGTPDEIERRQRPFVDLNGNPIPTRFSTEYATAFKFAEDAAKYAMIESVNGFVGNRIRDKETGQPDKLIDVKTENICFDVQPLPREAGDVTFSCNVRNEEGTVLTISATLPVSGYEDLQKEVNNFNDDTIDNTAEDTIYVTNAVFGAAVIRPKSFIQNVLEMYNSRDEPELYIYSLAYPQIDSCYGDIC